MILRQILHTDPVVASAYLLGCGGKGVGAVVDPVEDVGTYIELAERLGLSIRASEIRAANLALCSAVV